MFPPAIRHRLLAAGRIDQGEPRVQQTSVAAFVLPEAEIVGTPMQDGLKHRQGAVRIRARPGFAGDFSGNSAHLERDSRSGILRWFSDRPANALTHRLVIGGDGRSVGVR